MFEIGFGLIITGLWLAYEIYTAPMMDESGNITKEGKKLTDLFKKKNKNK